MFKQTLIGTIAAGFIATGTMVGAPATASAAVYFGGPHWGVRIGPDHRHWRHRHRVCRPVFRWHHWRDRWGRWHNRRVIVGHRCHWTYGRPWHGDYSYRHH